jgi:aspartate racemase
LLKDSLSMSPARVKNEWTAAKSFERVEPGQGVLGVLGGMGPAATADFYTRLIKATPATQDQDHIPVIVIGDPRIADRSDAIETGTVDNVFSGMLRGLGHLERIGVDAIAIPCNTAHFWLRRLQEKTDIPFISLIEASVGEARRLHSDASTALVLGTRATVNSRLYDAELQRAGFGVVSLTDQQQHTVNTIISHAKKGDLRLASSIFAASAQLWSGLADVVLLACTELPLVASSDLAPQTKFIDTTAALVNACVAWARLNSKHGRKHISDGLRARPLGD